ncbi:MAG: hypothetical protein V1676_03555 [Candidatus Diapherotrites archaeon]
MPDYDLIASLRRSKIKPQLLRLLQEPKTATDLKKIIGVHRESVSRALLEMERQKLVVCINPTQPNFRYYKTTEKGKKLLKKGPQ